MWLRGLQTNNESRRRRRTGQSEIGVDWADEGIGRIGRTGHIGRAGRTGRFGRSERTG